MNAFDPAAYGDSCAAYYDQLYPNVPAGLVAALAERWGRWARAPWVPGRAHCVSVYRTPAAGR